MLLKRFLPLSLLVSDDYKIKFLWNKSILLVVSEVSLIIVCSKCNSDQDNAFKKLFLLVRSLNGNKNGADMYYIIIIIIIFLLFSRS